MECISVIIISTRFYRDEIVEVLKTFGITGDVKPIESDDGILAAGIGDTGVIIASHLIGKGGLITVVFIPSELHDEICLTKLGSVFSSKFDIAVIPTGLRDCCSRLSNFVIGEHMRRFHDER